MNINELVPSFEACKKAKELGFPQETFFFYGADKHIKTNGKTGYMLYNKMQNIEELNGVAAPTLQEGLNEFVKVRVLVTRMPDGQYAALYPEHYKKPVFTTNPAQAALELWIKLKKDGVI